jgi:hypothetical protein
MRARLRMWMESWQVWAAVICLAYIWGILGRGPAFAAVSPRGLWVAQGLLAVALLVLSWFLSKYLVVPWVMFLQGAKLDERTAKAQEKLADSLMSTSTAVSSAVMISLLVVPFTAFIQTTARGIDPVAAVVAGWPPQWWSGWHTAVCLILFWVPVCMSLLLRRTALSIYDRIARTSVPPAASVADPTAQGAPESPSAPAGLQTTLARAGGG